MADQVSGILSPWLRRQRFRAVRPYLKGRILDYGCGTGTLAGAIESSQYVGVDQDVQSLDIARQMLPDRDFRYPSQLQGDERFDTIACLALIEHVPDPVTLLQTLAARLAPGGLIVLTTPHVHFEWVHGIAVRLGLASCEAQEEHETLFDERLLARAVHEAGLFMVHYQRFLLRMNQLVVASPEEPDAERLAG